MVDFVFLNIKKFYGLVDVIYGIDLLIKLGEFCVFVGLLGCGKLILLWMILGLELISVGELCIEDEIVNDIFVV